MTVSRRWRALVTLAFAAIIAFGLVLPPPLERGASAGAAVATGGDLTAPQASLYIVFRKLADGTAKPLAWRQVQLGAAMPSLSEEQVELALAHADRQSDLAEVTLEIAGRGLAYRAIAEVPRWVRAEFQGEKPDLIAGRILPQENPVFVVRLPALAGATLVIKDGARREMGRFDLGQLMAETPRINLEDLDVHVFDIRVTGSAANRVDWLILGDGYTQQQQSKFISDVRYLVDNFFSVSPYAEYANFVNVRALFVASEQSGADHPPFNAVCSDGAAGYDCCADPEMAADPLSGTFVNTAFGATYCVSNLHRLMGVDPLAVEAAAAAAPDYDQTFVLVNDVTYGGAGGAMSVASMSPESLAVAQHEYGHSFARLADEYDTPYPGFPRCSDVPGASGYPCEDNVTDLTARDQIKWRAWFDPTTPIPTEPQWDARFANVVGLFEGARYQPAGMYRSGYNCIMRSLNAPFCQVAAQDYVLRIYGGGWGAPWPGISLIEPDSVQPRGEFLDLRPSGRQTFRADVLQPIGSPPLRISWLVNGVVVPGATSPVFTYAMGGGQRGLVRITLRVQDATNLVHPAMAGKLLTSEHTWSIVESREFLPIIVNIAGSP